MSTEKTPTTPLYRIENPTIPAIPNGNTSHKDLVGQWFSPNINTALNLNRLRRSTQTSGKEGKPIYGTQLVIAHVPTTALNGLHVTRHPIAASMDVEGDNFIVPRDGSIPMDTLPLDETLGELHGKLELKNYSEAKARVYAMLGEIAVEAK